MEFAMEKSPASEGGRYRELSFAKIWWCEMKAKGAF